MGYAMSAGNRTLQNDTQFKSLVLGVEGSTAEPVSELHGETTSQYDEDNTNCKAHTTRLRWGVVERGMGGK